MSRCEKFLVFYVCFLVFTSSVFTEEHGSLNLKLGHSKATRAEEACSSCKAKRNEFQRPLLFNETGEGVPPSSLSLQKEAFDEGSSEAKLSVQQNVAQKPERNAHTLKLNGETPNSQLQSVLLNVTYVGAVLEYEPYSEWRDEEKGYGILRENANNFVAYAQEAKNQSADILITPEYGLQSLDMYYNSTANFLTFTQYVPDPATKMVPCSMPLYNPNFEAVQILSCGVLSNGIYLVVDMAELCPCSNATISEGPWDFQPSDNCPESGYFFYNTQVVFDRKGTVVARYRKQNLFLEDYFTQGPLDDTTAIFVTDFDVVFTLQICFDIVYEHPGYMNVRSFGIKDVAMSTAWADELPFDLADANQNGWSRGLKVNLLVSGFHEPENYKLGSGIFRAYSDELPIYSFDKNSGNVLLVGPVTTVSASSLGFNVANSFLSPAQMNGGSGLSFTAMHNLSTSSLKKTDRKHLIIHQDLSNYTSVQLSKGQPGDVLNVTACSNDDFCCDLSYEYSGNLTYYFMAFSGTYPVGYGEYFLGVQQCGIVWCRNSDYRTCALVELGLPESDLFGPFKISSTSFSIRSVYPVGNTRDLLLINNHNLKFENSFEEIALEAASEVKSLLTVALYGRWYARDS